MSGQDTVKALRERGAFAKPASNGRALDLVLVGVAVIAIACCGFFAFSWLSRPAGPAGGTPPTELVANVSSPTDRIWTEDDTAQCQAEADAAARNPDPSIAMQASAGLRGITDGGYARMATRMACMAGTKVARLCDPKQKATFIEAVNDYFNRVDLLLLGMNAQNGIVNMYGNLGGGEMAAGAGVLDDITQMTADYMRFYHRQVTGNLQGLVQQGLISSGDFGLVFGMGVPENIAKVLKDVPVTSNACA